MVAVPQPAALWLPQAEPAEYVVLDIESGDCPDLDQVVADALAKAEAAYTAPRNLKDPEKLKAHKAAHLAEVERRVREKSALGSTAPILCVSVRTEQTAIVFDGMFQSTPTPTGGRNSEPIVHFNSSVRRVDGAIVLPCGDERRMLLALRTWLDSATGPDTVLAGWNVVDFDLKKLCLASLRHRLRLPYALQPREGEPQSVLDLMARFAWYFWTEHPGGKPYMPMETALEVLGLPQYKSVISGKDVPRLYRAGDYQAIIAYAALEGLAHQQIYLLLTSQSGEFG
jgi:hypothetical protein